MIQIPNYIKVPKAIKRLVSLLSTVGWEVGKDMVVNKNKFYLINEGDCTLWFNNISYGRRGQPTPEELKRIWNSSEEKELHLLYSFVCSQEDKIPAPYWRLEVQSENSDDLFVYATHGSIGENWFDVEKIGLGAESLLSTEELFDKLVNVTQPIPPIPNL